MKPPSFRPTRQCLLLVILLFLVPGSLRAQQEDAAPRPVQLGGTQVRHIHSEIVGQDYDLYLSLPRGYQNATAKYPLIILLDAQWDFALTYSIYGQQYYDGFLPGCIIVGVTWGGKNPNPDSLRARDFTPSKIQSLPQSGGAAKFLAFIKGELIPYMESNYRASSEDRTLMGSSYGGLFTLYALFHETKVFGRYVLTSPPVGWDNRLPFTYEKQYAANNSRLPVRLSIGVGELELEIAPELENFINQIRARNYKDLQLHTGVFANIGHSGSKAEGYTRGLQFAFARPSLRLPDNLLDEYAGTYRIGEQFVVQIVRDNGRLVILAPGGTRIALQAEGDDKFYVKGAYMFMKFMRNDEGKVTAVDNEMFGGSQHAERVQ